MDRGHVDDRPLRLAELAVHGLEAREGGADVDRRDRVPLLDGRVEQGLVELHRGVVDERVDLRQRLERARDRRRVGEIDPQRSRPVDGAAVHRDDVPAVALEHVARHRADATRRAGDDHDGAHRTRTSPSSRLSTASGAGAQHAFARVRAVVRPEHALVEAGAAGCRQAAAPPRTRRAPRRSDGRTASASTRAGFVDQRAARDVDEERSRPHERPACARRPDAASRASAARRGRGSRLPRRPRPGRGVSTPIAAAAARAASVTSCATTRIPKPWPRRATACPIVPNPITPSVLPASVCPSNLNQPPLRTDASIRWSWRASITR